MILVGVIVGKYPMTIAGYNTMSKEQQKKVDIKAVSRIMRKTFFIMGIGIIIIPYVLQRMGYLTEMALAPLIIIVGGVVYMLLQTRKYTKTLDSSEMAIKEKNKRNTKKYMAVFITVVPLFLFFIYSLKPATLSTENNTLKISGIYGTSIPIKDIETVSLKESLPGGWRTNGVSIGHIQKGHFKLHGIGSCLLFTQNNKGPFIYITFSNHPPIIINKKTPEQTRELYEEIKAY